LAALSNHCLARLPVTGNAAAVIVEGAQIVHGLGIAEAGCLGIVAVRFGSVALHATAFVVHQSDIVDRGRRQTPLQCGLVQTKASGQSFATPWPVS
jgi:hypothetical protein